MKRLLMVVAAAVAVCGTAKAETVDLAGVDAAATLLTEETVYVNSSETTASLVFDNADAVAFAGAIQGNIAVVKQGAGELSLAGANTYSGGTYVSNGWLKVSADSHVGGGAVRLAGGNLRVGGAWTPSTVCVTLDADAAIDTGAYNFNVKPETFVTAGRTMTKVGSGMLVVGKTGFTGANVKGATWVIDEGSLVTEVLTDPFGYYGSCTDFTIELHEGTFLLAKNHLPLPARVVLRGAELRGAQAPYTSAAATYKWKAFSLNGTVTVVPSANGKASAVSANAMHMGNLDWVPTLVVQEGAELVMNVCMSRGRTGDSDTQPLTPGEFVKRGAGTLTVSQPSALAGVVRIEEGTLRLGKDGSLGKDASLVVASAAKVELDDGAVLDCRYDGGDLLSSADIWIDAASQVAAEGSQLYTIANRGRCGGSFVQGVGKSGTPPRPTYSSTALNGRPAFCFNGAQALVLNTYTNRSSVITVFAVARCTHWENVGNKGKWAAYLAMHSAASTANDNGVKSSLYHQDNGNYGYLFGKGGNVTLDHNATVSYLPVIDCIRRNGTAADAIQYVYNNGEVTSKTATQSASLTTALDIDLTAIGCRISDGGKLEYYGTDNTSTRCFYGDVGEILVFSRYVTDDERAAVNEYLSRKWFGVTNATVTASVYAGSAQPSAVSVPSGTATLATPQTAPGVLEKDGAGALQLNVMSDRHEVRVKEGTLALMPTSVVAHIDVWMDAADAGAVTTNAEGRVVSLRNKGNAGGAFGASPSPESSSYGAPTPVWERSGINSLPSLKFAGDSALVLDSYVNTNDYGFLTIFMVAERSPEFDGLTAGKGKWSAPISMASRNVNSPDNAYAGAFVYEESPINNSVNARMHRGGQETVIADITNKVPNAAAFVFSAYLCGYR
ncbi:MAG: autotransporter-associated beta strand repeat-containing protein [Kiritimatiellae bacterium]|nr:autotransporter-associated beta strand repeat-containing protein [Kiritimatiellia bacterium]